jgi:SulP family sulfate permease
MHFWDTISNINLWQWQSIAIGGMTILSMIVAPKIIKSIPAVIIALLVGVISYFAITLIDKSLLISSNPFIIGPISSDVGIFEAISSRFTSFGSFDINLLTTLIVPALTLAVLLSIDTLKTCVVLDALTHTRHNSNKELIGQGIANITSSCIGGMPGAGTMGATLVNISSGATTKLSGILEGILALIVFLALGSLIAWVPIASLAGILIVIGFRMIDIHSLNFLKSKSTLLDFVVILSVITVALTVSLIMASAVGVILAIILFIKEQVNTTIIHRKMYGNQIFSKQIRVAKEMEILQKYGDCSVIYELQGSLFFGTSNNLFVSLESDIKTKKYIILDMRRVQSVDLTASHILEQVKSMLGQKGGYLIFSRVPKSLPTGQDVRKYFGEVGLVEDNTKIFDDIDDAIEWVENRILSEFDISKESEDSLELYQFELFKNRKLETIRELQSHTQEVSFKAGEKIFSKGDSGDEIFLIRKGAVRIVLPINSNLNYHISTFGKGSFFGEFAFLDGATRSADAIADTDTEIFILSRAKFELFAQEHKKLALQFLEGIASVLAGRLRITNTEISAMD